MKVDLRDSAFAVRASRVLLGASVAIGTMIAVVPFSGRTNGTNANTIEKSPPAAHPAIETGSLAGASSSQSVIERNPFVAIEESPEGAVATKPSVGVSTPPNGMTVAAARASDMPQLVGTVVDRIGGSAAIVMLGSNIPRSVRLGGHVGSYRVDSIAPGIAVMVDSVGHTLILRLHSRS
jgi:hypothetical protein